MPDVGTDADFERVPAGGGGLRRAGFDLDTAVAGEWPALAAAEPGPQFREDAAETRWADLRICQMRRSCACLRSGKRIVARLGPATLPAEGVDHALDQGAVGVG